MTYYGKYLNISKYISRVVFLFNKYLSPNLESIVRVNSDCLSKHPPIFFLGAPRSGSTLAIQVITDCFDLGYMTNNHCRWFGAPFLVEKFKYQIKPKDQSNYDSDHGITFGDSEPSECGEWWYRFFRRVPAHVTLDDVSPNKMKAFHRSIALLTQTYKKPIIFKNLYESLRIQAIAHYIPEAVFIVTHRNEVENGHSLLETRRKVFGDYKTWWSMEPPGIDKLQQLPIHQQVIEQIRSIHAVIKNDLHFSGVNEDKIFHINYEEFCDKPAEAIRNLAKFFKLNGYVIERNSYKPSTFKRRKNIRIDKELYEAMKKYAEGI